MGESLRYVKLERVELQGNPEFNEAWLQQRVAEDPKLLGLGDEVYLAGKEVKQPQGGKLDLLLIDRETSTRYEVELMLGETDPSHIIRCIEYWDVERKRYPHVEHVAVLVAETVNSRFLNVIGLFNSVIPIIAMQVSALKLGDTISLTFTKVLDLVRPGEDDEDGAPTQPVGRKEWESWSSKDSMQLLDSCFEMIGQFAPGAKPNFRSGYIGIMQGNTVDNYLLFAPKKDEVRVWTHRLADTSDWKGRLAAAGVPVAQQREDKLVFSLTHDLLVTKREIVRSLFQEAFEAR